MVKFIFNSLVILLTAAGMLAITAGTGFSQQDQCRIVITKSTEPDSSEVFDFISIVNGVETQFSVAAGGQEDGAIVNEGESVIVTEVPREGWRLEEADCFFLDGAVALPYPGGVQVLCTEGGEFNGANCIFRNRQIPEIPTLSEWGMISAAAGLGLIGVFFAVRRRRMHAV
ncbi:MAG: IPTL-CTERM sorting domain-containing protein [Thermodesulfobacteriota bacterium]